MSNVPTNPPIPTLPYASGPPNPPGAGEATASLVLGIISAVFWLCPIVGFVVAVVGLVLGISSHGKHRSKRAKAGIILCVIGLVLTVVNGGIGAYMGATGRMPWLNKLLQPGSLPPPGSSGPAGS